MCIGTYINTNINTHIHTCAHIHTNDNPKSLEKCEAAQLNTTLSTALPTYACHSETTMGKVPLSLETREEEAKDEGEREGSSKDSCPCKRGYLFLTIAKSPVTFQRV